MKTARTTLLLLLCAAAPAFAAARAELSPAGPLAPGAPARLTVTTDDPDAEAPAPPRITGADVSPTGSTTRVSIINGEVKRETGFVFTVVPRREGTLEVPPIAVGRETTQPLQVEVSGAAAAAPAAKPTEPQQRRAFARLQLEKSSLRVGEAVPVKIRAFFSAGTSATLKGEPKLDSDAFTLSQLSEKPAQTEVEVGGQRYLQATWTGVLSAAKPMKGPLRVQIPVELAYREAAAAPRPQRSLRDLFGSDPFADSFFDDPFFKPGSPFADLDSFFDIGAMRRRDVTLTATAGTVTVTELPEQGRPPGFAGAVGRFELTLAPLISVPRAGEPLVLEARATGSGTFDRLALTGVAESDDFKTYPVKAAPAGDAARGPRVFKQTVVPRRAGTLTLPALELPYFDAEKGRYAVARSEPLELVVAGTPGVQVEPPPGAEASETAQPAPSASAPLPLTFEPLYRQPRVWALSGAALGLVAVLGLLGALRNSPRWAVRRRRAQLRRAVSRHTAELRRAAEREDAPGFFAAARQALQLRLGALWSIAPEAVTAADVSARLGPRGERIREVLEQADRASYGSLPGAERLEAWLDRVLAELDALERHMSPSPTESHP